MNVNNGERFDTYTIPGKAKSGVICLNGPAARLGTIGDEIIIISYAEFDEVQAKSHEPKVVLVDKRNRIKKIIKGHLEQPGAFPGRYVKGNK